MDLLDDISSNYYDFNLALHSTQFSLEFKPWSEISRGGSCPGIGKADHILGELFHTHEPSIDGEDLENQSLSFHWK